ncbi:MAG: hypothetical protein MAG795_01125 [Candidatus Woesearchaeota archaeon]|nr:hypothetical protein [Candidatus Woesearchaeota archaeon]
MKKGQYSTEALITVSFALAIFMAAFFFITRETQDQQQNLELAQVDKIGKAVIKTTNQLAKSSSSKSTLELTLPQGVNNIFVENNNSLVFNYSKDRTELELVFFADADIVFDMNEFFPGLKTLIIESKQGYVSVCDKDTDHACNKVCDFTRGENQENAPGDCCTSDCSACNEDNNYLFCTNDSACHSECYRHNGCSVMC